MRYRTQRRTLLSTAAAAAVLGSGAERSTRMPVPARPDVARPCSVEFVPSRVSAGRPDTRVLAESDLDEVEGRPRVRVPERSGIRVVEVRNDVAAGSWVLLLDLTDARAGGWRVTLTGEGYRCDGELELRASVGADDDRAIDADPPGDSAIVGLPDARVVGREAGPGGRPWARTGDVR